METDCRSEEGITVGLIDAIISICRILAKRDFHNDASREALLDLRHDEDVRLVCSDWQEKGYLGLIKERDEAKDKTDKLFSMWVDQQNPDITWDDESKEWEYVY